MHKESAAPSAEAEKLRELVLEVRGLACHICARRVEQVLQRLAGVEASIRSKGRKARGISSEHISAAPFVSAAAFANLLALDHLAAEDAPGSVALVRLGLTALVLIVSAFSLFRGRLREPLVSRDRLAFLAAIGAFGLGLLELGPPPLAPLSRVGLGAEALHAIHAAGFETAAAIVLAVCLARGAAAALAHAARADLDARDKDRATSVRRLGEDGALGVVPIASLRPGDRVKLLEGGRAPLDLELLGPARVSAPFALGPFVSVELPEGGRMIAGAVLLSGDIVGRVVRCRAAVAAAMDAEVHCALSGIDASGAHPRPFSWSTVAVQTLLISAVSFSIFAAFLHAAGFADPGRGGSWAALSAIAVIAGSSTAAFSLAAPIARCIAVLQARKDAVVVKDPEALERLAAVAFACFDEVATTAFDTPRALFHRGVGCRLLSELPLLATAPVAHHLGIPCSSGLSPAGKARAVEELAREGGRVLFVGRGGATMLPAGVADVTIAIAKGMLPTAVDAPIVVNGGPERLPPLIDQSRALCRRLRENAVITAAYNAAVIPAAALGFISPIQAAGLALIETALVLANSARLLGAPRPARPLDCASQEPAARATISAS